MREYTVKNLLWVPKAPGVPDPPPGPVGSKEKNVRQLLDHRWLSVLKWLEADIRSGSIQIANETARTLRMAPERCTYVVQHLRIPLEEYLPERRLDISPVPPAPGPPGDERRRPRRSFWHLHAVGLPGRGRRPPGIGRGHGINVAVIDSGADSSHPELTGKVLQALAIDPQGRVEQIASSSDLNGHGTFVSSLVAGKTVGVAPAARLVSLQVLDAHGHTTAASILSALNWVASASVEGKPLVRVVVLCLGFREAQAEPSAPFQTAMLSLMNRGILPVVAFGNEGPGNATSPGDCYAVLSVGAMTRRQKVASFSGNGQREYSGLKYAASSLVAPGEDVFSAVPGAEPYAAWTGGTPATAVAAGLAALLAERRPDLDAWQLRDHLLSQCRRLSGEPGERQGAGLMQIESGDAR